MRKIKIGEYYRHFKNKTYLIKDIVNDCESVNSNPLDKIIIYQALYDDKLVWARKYDDFVSEVDHNKYPNIKQKYRFEKIVPSLDDYLIKSFMIINYEINYSSNTIISFMNNMKNIDISIFTIGKKDYYNREEINDSIFINIENSNMLIIDYSENDTKLPLFIEHARCNDIPIYIIVKKGIMIPSYMNKLVNSVIKYNELNEIHSFFKLKKDSKTLDILFK